MPGSIPMPVFKVYAALDSTFSDPTPDWEELDIKVRSITITRGKNDLMGRSEAGSCKIQIVNDNGYMDIDNPHGPYYGRLKRGKRVKVELTYAGEAYPRFTGYIRRLQREFPGIVDDTITMELSDGFFKLKRTLITHTYGAAYSGARIADVLTAAYWPSAGNGNYGDESSTTRYIDAGTEVFAETELDKRPALEHILHCEQSEFGLFFILRNGAARWVSRDTLQDSAIYKEVQATFGTEPGDLPYIDVTPDYGDDGMYNNVSAKSILSTEVQTALNQDSIDEDGDLAIDGGELLLVTDNKVLDWCYYYLYQAGTDGVKVRGLKCLPLTNSKLFEFVLDSELRTLVQVDKRFKGYSTSFAANMEGYTETIDFTQGTWELSMNLIGADVQRYWILGDPVYGVLGETTYLGF